MTSSRRCETIKKRLTQLYEDYDAVVGQMGRVLSVVEETHLKRHLEELETKIEEWEEKVRRCELDATQTEAQTATSPNSEPPALAMARRALAVLETQAAAYTTLDIPVHLQLNLEEKRKQVEDLEARWRAGEL